MMEEFLELQEKVGKLQKKITDYESDINDKDKKIIELSERINGLTNESAKNASDTRHFRSMVSVLETDKKNLERERDRLIKENEAFSAQLKQFANTVETINQTLQTKEEVLLSKEKQLQHKDELIIEKDTKIEQYRQQFNELYEEKEKYQQEKFSFMEQLNKEKLELIEKIGTMEKSLADVEQKMQNYKRKSKDAQDGLMGATMEIDSLNEKLAKMTAQLQEITTENEKLKISIPEGVEPQAQESSSVEKPIDNEQLTKYKQRISELELKVEQLEKASAEKTTKSEAEAQKSVETEEDIFAKGTGSYKSLSALVAHFKFKLNTPGRNIRIILPDLVCLDQHGMTDIIYNLPLNILKNIACDVDPNRDNAILNELRRRNFKITDYKGPKLFALTMDSADAALAVFEPEKNQLIGIFSNNEELVKLLSQAIMNPFIKGVKL